MAATTPAFVQKNDGQITSGKSISVGFNSSNVAGHLIVAYVIWNNIGSVSLSDSRGNAYISAVGPTTFDSGKSSAQLFYAKNIAGGPNAVTATFSTSVTAYGILYIHEYSGLDTTAPLDVVAAASGTNANMNSGSVTTKNASDLLFGAGVSTLGVTNAGTSYVVRSTDFGNISEDRNVSAVGSYNATATQNGNSWAMQFLALKAASGSVPTISSFTSSPAIVASAGTSTLSWTVTNATSIAITPGTFTSTTLSGTTTVNPTVTTTYTLTATSASGSTTSTATVTVDATAPTVPQALTVSSTTASTAALSWTSSTDSGGSGLAGYKIFRCTGTCTPTAQVGTTSSTTFTDTGLAGSTGYTYAVAALDNVGNVSANSNTAVATTKSAAVPAVSAFTANPTLVAANGVSTLSWTVTNATSIAITPGTFTSTNLSGTTTVNPTVTTTYTLTATSASGSATATATVSVDATAPTVPQNLGVTSTTSSTESLSWTASTDSGGSGLAGYKIFRCSGSSCTPTTQIGTTTSAAYTDTGLTASTTYRYEVAAYDNAGNVSASSGIAAASTDSSSLPAISSFKANPTLVGPNGASTLSWTVTNATSIAITPGTFTSTTLSGTTTVNPTVTTTYTLTATSASGSTTSTATVTVDATAPTVPQTLAVTSTTMSTATLTWGASSDSGGSGLAGYKIFRCSGTCTPTTQIGSPTSTSYTDTGLTASTLYTYAVAAYDNVGNTSANSNSAPATTAAQPVPTISSFVVTPSSIIAGQSTTLSWTTANATSLSISPGVGTVTGSTSTIVNPIGNVTYTLTATNSFGSTTAQATVSVTSDTTAPTVPANLIATATSSTQINLSWAASTDNVGVAGYEIFRNGVQVGTTPALNYSDSGLSASTTYSYAVAAYDAVPNVSGRSPTASATTLGTSNLPAFPIKVGPTGRYLVDQNNVPFLMVGDSPHALFADLTEAQADAYFADRQSFGINTLWAEILVNPYVFGRSDASTYDGIVPFTTPGDFSTPNPAYFQRVDDMINLAASHGITILLDSLETGGWTTTAEQNGNTKCFNFGVYMGNRYKNFPNIIWILGNDFQTWNTSSTDNTLMMNIMAGIASVDSKHIQTTELNYELSGSLDDALLAPYSTLGSAYTYFPTYDEVLTQYNKTTSVPIFMVEEHYEYETVGGCCSESGTPNILRRQEYWTVLAGGLAGSMYGNHYTWTLDGPQGSASWTNFLDSPGAQQLSYMKAVFTSHAWYNLVPDQNHTFVTAGYGTYSSSGSLAGNNYVTAALTPDGTLGMAYVPNTQTITVNMAQMAGKVTAQWFDPSNGTYAAIQGSPFSNSGSQLLTPPATNSGGDSDWLLVLTATTVQDTQPPTAPSNLAALAVSSTQINLSWSASTDNVGVAGYKVFLNGTQVTSTGSTSILESGLSPNTTYMFNVSAYDAAGNVSSLSPVATATTPSVDTTPPTVPANLAATNITVNSASLSWTPSTDNVAVAGYQIFKNGTLVGTTSTNNYVATGLIASTSYSFAVTAYDASNNVSALSAPKNVTTAAAAPVQPAQVQMTSNDVASGTTVSAPFSSPATTGNLIVVYVVYDNPGTVTVSDSAGNVYQSAVNPTAFGDGNNWRAQIFYAKNISGGPVTVKATFSTSISIFGLLYIHEYTGLDQLNPLDVVAASSGATSTMSSGSLNTTHGTDLLFGAAASQFAVNTFSPGFVTRSVAYGNLTEDELVNAMGTYSATGTQNGTSWVFQLVAFKAAQ
jgi:chitodextrinase